MNLIRPNLFVLKLGILVLSILSLPTGGAKVVAAQPGAAVPAPPVITPGTGTYTSTQNVVITDATAGASIYYTIDGSLPSVNSTLYTAPIPIAASTMLRAVALVTGAPASPTVTSVLNFTPVWPLAAFGDSITSGMEGGTGISYPNQIARITGQPSVGGGVGGQSSGQISVRMNAFEGTQYQTIATAFTIPITGNAEITFPLGYEPCHRALSGNGILITIQSTPQVTGYCKDDGTGKLWFKPLVYPAIPVEVIAGTPWVAELGNQLYQCVGIEEGRNEIRDPQTVLDNVAASVSAVQRTTSCYFILSILNGDTSGEWAGDAAYSQIESLNQALATKYGAHFIDVRSYLVSSFDPNNQLDVMSHRHDSLPFSLRALVLTGTLTSNIADGTTCAFSISDPPAGTKVVVYHGDILTIDSEKIFIENGTSGSWNCVRGYGGTTPAAHALGTAYSVIDFLHPGQNPASLNNPYCGNGYTCMAYNVYEWLVANSPHTVSPASMTFPNPGAVLSGPTVTFKWSAGKAAPYYSVRVGTTGPGSSDLYDSGTTNSLSATVSNIPIFGFPVYVRLFSKIDGSWQYVDYVYTEAGSPTLSAMTFPKPGAVLQGSQATFNWTAGGGVTSYYLNVGTTGVGAKNLYDSGQTGILSTTVSSIPAGGAPVYVRLGSNVRGTWQSVDYVYTEATPAALTSPAPGTKLTGATATFTWSAGGAVTAYEIKVGTSGPGANNLYDSGVTTARSAVVANIPKFGNTVFLRLGSKIGGIWQAVDYVVTEAGTPVVAVLTSPAANAILPGSTATFKWNAGIGASAYAFTLGSRAGTYDLYRSGTLTGLSTTVSNIPTSGATVYARMGSKINGTWNYSDSTFTEAFPATLISPAPSTVLLGSKVTFTWSIGGSATSYALTIGTTGVRSNNVYKSPVLTALSTTVSNIPTSGVTIYVTLGSKVGGVWEYVDYVFTEAGTSQLAQMISPKPGTLLVGPSVTFTWSAGNGILGYEFDIGTRGAGSNDVYGSGTTLEHSVTVSNIPGGTNLLYVRLGSQLNGSWKYSSYIYSTAASGLFNSPLRARPGKHAKSTRSIASVDPFEM